MLVGCWLGQIGRSLGVSWGHLDCDLVSIWAYEFSPSKVPEIPELGQINARIRFSTLKIGGHHVLTISGLSGGLVRY